ncbi:hypothetical protein [Paraburkholderia oxyphila]|uniref:hypothetical protein n=1 Tax=Paraburkholderia oxyphila TaxID=614212 RepID=UPI000489914B|nr:hypothetical protein [Paraburkholderia oxyphila]
MKTTAFKFRTRGIQGAEIRYSVIVIHNISVTFIRTGSKRKPFCLMVPRERDNWPAHVGAEDLARIALAQSLRDGLIDTHPEEAIDLDIGECPWDGELTAEQ